MKVEKRDGANERRVLVGMITDKAVLGQIASRWEDDLFKSRWGNLVGKWCVDYYNRYHKAPQKAIEDIFSSWAGEAQDKATVRLVDSFLASLSDEYEALAKESNADFIIDLAAKHFNEVKARNLIEEAQGFLDVGQSDKVWELMTKTHKMEVGVGAGVDVFSDRAAVESAFADRADPLIRYPGALANFYRDSLCRDGFIAFMGPEKRGKSWALLDMAFRAAIQRRKVAFFSIGDMSQNQVMRRLMIRAARAPWKPAKVKWPTFIEYDPDDLCAKVDHKILEFKKPLEWGSAWNACKELLKSKIKSKESYFKLSCHPNSSLNVFGLKSVLDSWDRNGWNPDVIIIDYADLFAPIQGYLESRDSINATWKHLRGLSQELHCLVVTATQADAASYKAKTVDMSNFSEDKRKLSHVTGMVGLNQTPEEKEHGVIRYNWVVLREDEFTQGRCIHVAGCLPLGNPCVKSTF